MAQTPGQAGKSPTLCGRVGLMLGRGRRQRDSLIGGDLEMQRNADKSVSASFPDDLARHVHSQLFARKARPPSVEVLTRLFEALYFASLRREESQSVSCRVAFIDRKRPDPHPPKRIVASRWQFFVLADDLPLDVSNLVKLSTAVDPWGSTLAVDTDSEGRLRIWGLIDQSVHYSAFVVKEAESGPEMPGVFQAVIQGTGEIAVYKTYLLLGSLRQDTLVTLQQSVFHSGPVHSRLMRSIKTFQEQVRKKVGSDLYGERGHWNESLESTWISALCRILIGIRKYQHGGSVLISDESLGLNPKYSLEYHRLADSLFRASVLSIKHTAYSDIIGEKYLDSDAGEMPTDL